MRHIISVVIGISAALTVSPVRALEPDQLPLSYTLGVNAGTAHMGFPDGAGGVLGNRATGSTLGVDTIPTFESYFYDPGFNTNGFHQYTWQYRMVGRAPFKGGEDGKDRHDGDRHDGDGQVTRFSAPVVPVTVDLRNADGSPRFVNGQPLISSPGLCGSDFGVANLPADLLQLELHPDTVHRFHTARRILRSGFSALAHASRSVGQTGPDDGPPCGHLPIRPEWRWHLLRFHTG